MAKNLSLNAASVAKQDEFYTQYKDIQNELNHYEKHFKDKTVLCNCDDSFESNFCKFFLRNFNYLGLKRLICTSYITSSIVGKQMTLFDWMDEPVVTGNGYVMDIKEVPMANGRGVSDEDIDKLLKSKKSGVKKLKGDGDFRSEECIEYLKQADIVVTNPPFSLFREYVALLMEYDNYDAINVNKVADIPKDYFECMAVPITYVDKHNPEEFDIINANDIRTNAETPVKGHGLIKDKDAVITTYAYKYDEIEKKA